MWNLGQENAYDRRRWWVLATLFLVTFINYFDRQTLGCAIEPIGQEFGLGSGERGHLLAAFVTTYAVAHLFVGFLTDRIRNIRFFFATMVVGWSLCTILIGFARSYASLLTMRYALGIFEAVNFPICLMIISRIFPAKERTLASGIFSSGAFLATLAAPKFTIYLSMEYSWRYAFVIAGLLGLLWLIPWFLLYRNHRETGTTKNMGATNLGSWMSSLYEIVRKPAFWGVTAVGIGVVPCLYFCTQWLPSYFTQELQQSYNQALADKLTIIYLFQDVGMWVSGALVFWLANRGITVLKARKAIMMGGYCLMMSVLLLFVVKEPWLNVVIFSVFIFGLGACLSNQHAFKQDVLPGQVAAVAALVGFCETLFTSYVLQRIGNMVEATGNYRMVIGLLAGCATFAIVSAFLLLRRKWVVID